MRHIIRDLKPILRLMIHSHRITMLSGLGLAGAASVSGLALLGLSGWFITATAIAGASTVAALAFDVFAPSAGIRLLALSRTATRYGERLVTHNAALALISTLREQLFRGWAANPRALQMQPSRLLFRLMQDIDALDSLYLRVIVPVASTACVTLVISAALGLMHPALGAGVGVFLVLSVSALLFGAASAASRTNRRRLHAFETMRARVIDLVQGQTDLIMVGQLGAQQHAIMHADRRLKEADNTLSRIDAKVTFALGTLHAVLLSGLILAVAYLAEHGTTSAPVATLGILIGLGAMEPFSALRRGAQELGRTILASRRIGPHLSPTPDTVDERADPPPEQAIELVDIEVSYPHASHPVLKNIDLVIAVGERVALIGPSGAGKSSLLALLASELRAGSGVVAHLKTTLFTQRTELFQDSLRENIRLARPGSDDATILRAIEAAGLATYVRSAPDGLDSKLGEGGLGLSGGEARRLALARLFLRETPVWLLDEPTESLDGETARDVLRRINTAANSDRRTLVIATHVRREAEIADRLVVMRDGQIARTLARGTHEFDKALIQLRPD